MRGATGVTIQPHQILRLSRRKTHILSPHHIWNVIYSARSNRCHHPTSPNTAPATKNDSTALSSSHMKRHFQCAEQQVSLSNLTKYCACHEKWHCKISKKISKNRWNVISNAGPIRAWSDHDPTMKTQTATRLASEVTFRAHHEHFLLKNTTFRAQSYIQTFTKYCACHVKCHLNFTKYCACHAERLTYLVLIAYETSFTVRGATGVTIQPHQILRLPRKMTRLLYRPHIWNVIYNAGSNRCHHPTSPNTAPATQNDSHAWSSSHMKPHFQCAEQQVSRSNLTKYCACHEKWHCKISKKISKNRWNVISNAGPIRPWSEHDPSMIRAWSENENANRNPPRNRGYFSTSPRAFSIVKYNVSRPILHSNLHQVLRLPRKVTLERHQVLRLPRKVTLERHQVLRLPQKVPLELHQVLRLPRKVTLELHQVLRLPRKVTLERHQVLRLPRKVTLERHQVLHLPRKVTLERHQVLHLPRKVTLELHQVLHLPRKVTLELHYSTLLDSTLLYLTLLDSTWLYLTLLDSTWLYLILLDSSWLYSTRLYLTLLYSTWLYLTLLDSTWLYLTLLDSTWLYLTLVDSTLLDSTWLYSTLLDSTWLCLTRLDSTWLYLTLLDSTWFYLILLDSTWHYSTRLYLTLLDSTWLCLTLLDSTWLYLTLLDSTWFYLTLLDSTLLDSTWLYSTWLYLTLLYLTLLDFNLTGMSFVYRKFLS